MVDWMTPEPHNWSWKVIIAQLTMTINFFPEHIWPGPYWFFGLMMQLYILYRLILYRRHWAWTIGAIVICWAIQAMCFDNPNGEAIMRIRYNCIGSMLPFGMGLLAARTNFEINEIWKWCALTIVSALGVVLFSQTFHLWLWAPALVIIFNVALIKSIPEKYLYPLNWLGILSSAIFVCHPITRKIFIPIAYGVDILDGLTIYIVTTLVLAMIFKKAIVAIKQP